MSGEPAPRQVSDADAWLDAIDRADLDGLVDPGQPGPGQQRAGGAGVRVPAATAHHVACVLARAMRDGVAEVSVGELARRCRRRLSTVRGALRAWTAVGYLTVKPCAGQHGTTVYLATVPPNDAEAGAPRSVAADTQQLDAFADALAARLDSTQAGRFRGELAEARPRRRLAVALTDADTAGWEPEQLAHAVAADWAPQRCEHLVRVAAATVERLRNTPPTSDTQHADRPPEPGAHQPVTIGELVADKLARGWDAEAARAWAEGEVVS